MPWETTLDHASCWQELDDPRSGNAALHDFLELLMIACCAVLCSGQGAVDRNHTYAASSSWPMGRKAATPSAGCFADLIRISSEPCPNDL